MEIINHIKKLISIDEIDKAFNHSLMYAEENNLKKMYDEITLIKNQYYHQKEVYQSGQEPLDNIFIYRNKIINRLLETLNKYSNNQESHLSTLKKNSVTIEITIDESIEKFNIEKINKLVSFLSTITKNEDLQYIGIRRGSIILKFVTTELGARRIIESKIIGGLNNSPYKILDLKRVKSVNYGQIRFSKYKYGINKIILLGPPGSGKSTFASVLIRHLYQNDYRLELNMQKSNSAKYFTYLLESINNLEFPVMTGVNDRDILDFQVYDNKTKKNMQYALDDISGELFISRKEMIDLIKHEDTYSKFLFLFLNQDPEYNYNSWEFNPYYELTKYLKESQIPVAGIAIILSKFDLINHSANEEIEKYFENKYPILYNALIASDKGIKPNIKVFPFSVGKVQRKHRKQDKLISVSDRDIQSVLQWIFRHASKKKK